MVADSLLDRVVVGVCVEVEELVVVGVVEAVSVADVSVTVVAVVEDVRVAEVVTVAVVDVVAPFGATGRGPPVEVGGPVVEPDPGDGVELCGAEPDVPLESFVPAAGADETGALIGVAEPLAGGADGAEAAGAKVVGVEDTGSEGSDVGAGGDGAGLGGPASGPWPAAGDGTAVGVDAAGAALAPTLSTCSSDAAVPADPGAPPGAPACGASARLAPAAGPAAATSDGPDTVMLRSWVLPSNGHCTPARWLPRVATAMIAASEAMSTGTAKITRRRDTWFSIGRYGLQHKPRQSFVDANPAKSRTFVQRRAANTSRPRAGDSSSARARARRSGVPVSRPRGAPAPRRRW